MNRNRIHNAMVATAIALAISASGLPGQAQGFLSGGVMVDYDSLPAPARWGIDRYYRESDGCNGLSETDFIDRLIYDDTVSEDQKKKMKTVLVTDYNSDSLPDYIFDPVCDPPCNGVGCVFPVMISLLSKGSEFAVERIDKDVLKVNGKLVLAEFTPCRLPVTEVGFDYDNVCWNIEEWSQDSLSWKRTIKAKIVDGNVYRVR